MNWPRAFSNIVLIAGVIFLSIMFQNPKYLWLLLLLLVWN